MRNFMGFATVLGLAACTTGPNACPDGYFQDAGGTCVELGTEGDDTKGDDKDDDDKNDDDKNDDESPASGTGKNTGDAVEGESAELGSSDNVLYVVNVSDVDVCEVYFSACDDDELGEDLLGDYVLTDDAYLVIFGFESGCYDLWAWDCEDVDADDPAWMLSLDLDGEFTVLLTD